MSHFIRNYLIDAEKLISKGAPLEIKSWNQKPKNYAHAWVYFTEVINNQSHKQLGIKVIAGTFMIKWLEIHHCSGSSYSVEVILHDLRAVQ